MLIGQSHRFAMTIGQGLGLAAFATAIDWTDSVNDVLGCELSAGCDDCLSGREASYLADNLTALGKYGRPTCAMNRTVYSSATQQG